MKKILLGCLITVVLLGIFVPHEYFNLAKMFRYSQLSAGCLNDEEERKMRLKNISREEQEAIARKTFLCIKSKQNFIERALTPIPNGWLDPSSASKS